MFGYKLSIKEKIFLTLYVVLLLIMSFSAGNYYKNLWVFSCVFVMWLYTMIAVMREDSQEENPKDNV